MKKFILTIAMVGVVASPLAIFAADPVVTPKVTSAGLQTTPTGASQEKILKKKLGQIKKKNKDTKQKIKTNIAQSKAQVNKVKKDRAKTKKMRVTGKRVKNTTASSTVR